VAGTVAPASSKPREVRRRLETVRSMKKMRMGKTKRLVVRVEKTMSITARAWRRRGRERVTRFKHQTNHSRTGSDAL